MDTEREYAKKLAELRWGEDWSCARCGSGRRYQLRSRPRTFECADCGKQQSVTAGTVIHGMRHSLATWFRAVQLFSSDSGVSTRELAELIEVPVKTAFQLLHRLRKALDVEDEMLVGLAGRFLSWVKSTRHPRRAPRTNLLVAVDRESRLFLGLEAEATQANLEACCPEADTTSEEAAKRWPAAYAVLCDVRMRLSDTYRQVSGRYLQRYVRECAFLWRQARRGGLESGGVDPEAWAVMERCMATPRYTFTALQPRFG